MSLQTVQIVSIKTLQLLLACWRAHVHIISNCNQIHAVCSNNNSNNITIFRAARDIGTIASSSDFLQCSSAVDTSSTTDYITQKQRAYHQ
eukprot:11459-Heterococcus_DN1.PRE.4